ncbi:MAG: hypothetical protein ACOCVZ_04105 [Gemmatimonadota bacterium]
MKLRPGRYLLTVESGAGPAGVHRTGRDVHVDRAGGRIPFRVPDSERVYLWWRGAARPPRVRLVEPDTGRQVETRLA